MAALRAEERGDWLVARVLQALATSSIGLLGLLTVFIFREGWPLLHRVGIAHLLLGTEWHPREGSFGLLPMLAGSAAVTAGALLLGVPLGLCCAITLAELAPPLLRTVLKPAIELLAGIPSVVYGFLGIVLLLPAIRRTLGGPGASALAAALILAVMILPTIIAIAIDAMDAVPAALRDGSLALGATRWQTIRMVVLPAARSGILAAIILGMGRAVGETMAVIMVAGNAVLLPRSPLSPVRTLTTNIALEMGYASGDHQRALFATGIVLFVIIMALNALASLLGGRRR